MDVEEVFERSDAIFLKGQPEEAVLCLEAGLVQARAEGDRESERIILNELRVCYRVRGWKKLRES